MHQFQRAFRCGKFCSAGALVKAIHSAKGGSVAVEFAFILPILLVMFGGIVDYGLAMHQAMRLENAARAGAQFALGNSADTQGITATVKNAAHVDPTLITVTTSQFCECADGSTVTCGDQCLDSSANKKFIAVMAEQDYESYFSLLGLSPPQVSGQAVIRVQ